MPERKKNRRSIRSVTVLMLAISLGGLIALFLLSFRIQMRGLIQTSEAQSLLHQSHALETSLHRLVRKMPDIAEAWAVRDSVQRHLSGREDTLAADLLAENPFMEHELSLLALVDAAGNTVYTQYFDYYNYTYREPQDGMELVFSMVGGENALSPDHGLQEPVQGFHRQEGNVYYLCSAPVFTEENGAYAGTLIVGKLIDGALLESLTSPSSHVSFVLLPELQLSEEERGTLTAENGVLTARGKNFTAYCAVTSLLPGDDLLIALSSSAPYYRGVKVMVITTLLLAVAGIAIVLFVMGKMGKMVADPLERLGSSLSQVDLEHFTPLEPVGTVSDTARLTDAFNHMLLRAKTDREMIVESRDLMFYMANYDNLTYLFNRFSSQSALTERIETARQAGEPITIFFLDIDKFKNINDSMGHDVGNKLFLMIAERMREGFPPDTLLARMGGDEFMIAGVEQEGQPTFRDVIYNIFHTPFVVKERDIILSSSVGCTHYPQDGEDAETLIKNAEIAMYRAKDLVEDRFVVYQEQFQAALQENIEMENRMRRVIAEGCQEFCVFLQPKVTIENGEIIRCEALLRWFTKAGMIAPDDFIPRAEDSGLIVPLTWWLIRECCRIGRKLQDLRKPHIISINIPAQVLLHKDFLSVMQDAVRESGVDITLLDIEITESTLLNDMERVNEVLKELHRMGTEVSIDDFGTGYSSLSYLSKLAVDRIKIDREFVKGIDQDEESRDIVRAIIALAKSLKMVVTAEGVENWAHFSFLREIGCDEAQGYYICRPTNNEDYYSFVKNWDEETLVSGNL